MAGRDHGKRPVEEVDSYRSIHRRTGAHGEGPSNVLAPAAPAVAPAPAPAPAPGLIGIAPAESANTAVGSEQSDSLSRGVFTRLHQERKVIEGYYDDEFRKTAELERLIADFQAALITAEQKAETAIRLQAAADARIAALTAQLEALLLAGNNAAAALGTPGHDALARLEMVPERVNHAVRQGIIIGSSSTMAVAQARTGQDLSDLQITRGIHDVINNNFEEFEEAAERLADACSINFIISKIPE